MVTDETDRIASRLADEYTSAGDDVSAVWVGTEPESPSWFHYGGVRDREFTKRVAEKKKQETTNRYSAQMGVWKDVPESALRALFHFRLTDSAEKAYIRCK
jgi:uncharacterized protein (DUF924 family)